MQEWFGNRIFFSSCQLNFISLRLIEIAPPGFEPGSPAPEADILDRCTMGLYLNYKIRILKGCYKKI
jgi:hypothetical protein